MKRTTTFLFCTALAAWAQSGGAPTVTYLLDSSWQTGLQGEITIANPGTTAISNWTLKFTYPYAISSIWNAVIASHTGNVYTIKGASWDTAITGGSSVNFGWIASNNGNASGPTACYLNNLSISSSTCPASSGTADTTPPTVPANLASPSQTTSTISLQWSPSSDSGSGVAGYIVWENGIQLGNTTTTKFTAAGLAQNTAYTFTVQAFDNAGNISANTAPLTVKTAAVIPCSAPPAAPSSLAVTNTTSSSIAIAWTASPAVPNCTISYSVYNGSSLVASGVTASSYQFTGLTASTAYTFGVVASDQSGNSVESYVSGSTKAYVPPPPSGWPSRVFAPYIDMTAWPTPSLPSIASQTGQNYFTLAFVTSQGTCQASWGGVESMSQPFLADIVTLQQAGGNVIVSFGGENGVELAQSCTTVAATQAQYQSVIDLMGLTRIDFDIEGGAVADAASIDRRNKALAAIQAAALAKNKPLIVQYTLPVLPTGLTNDGVNLVTNAVQNGVDIGILNVMAMDYGPVADPTKMGANAIAAMQSTFAQLQTIYGSAKTPQQLYAMLGVTPMLGMNDSSPEIFSLSDAQSLLGAAQSNGIGLLAMWSVGRDQSCPNNGKYVASNCSGIVETPYQFTSIFGAFTNR